MSDPSPASSFTEPGPNAPPAPPPEAAAHSRPLAFSLAAAGVLLLAAAARLARWREAYWGPELVPLDGDSIFHFRRMLYAARHFSLPGIEPDLNWPKGAPVPFAPGYDVMGAVVAWGFGGPDSRVARAAVAAMPSALGVLLVGLSMLLAFSLAMRSARRPAALSAGLLTALIPQLAGTSRFGQTDHHVIEGILVALLALWSSRAVEGRRGPRCGAGIALLTFGGIACFPGTPLYLAIAVVPVAVATLFDPDPEPLPGWPAAGLVAGAVVSAILLTPYILGHGRTFSFNYASYLQPLLAAILGFGLLAAAFASHAGRPGRRVAVLAGVVLAVAVVLALIPGVARQLREAVLGYLLGRDPWLARNDECQPLWSPSMGLGRGRTIWGITGLSLPLLVPIGLALSWKKRRAAAAAFAFVALCMVVLTALESRFGRAAMPVLAGAGGVALALLFARLFPRPRITPVLAPALIAAALLADPWTWMAFRPQAWSTTRDALVAAAFDLAHGRRADETMPGVVVPWDMANEVLFLSDRPVVADGFGTWPDPEAFVEAERAYTSSEAELVAYMERRRLGYLIAGLNTFMGRMIGPGAENPMNQRIDLTYRRAVPLASTVMAGMGNPDAGLPHLEHFMPRFVSFQVASGQAQRIPILWTYERVLGARLTGTAPAGSRVALDLEIAARGHKVVWRAWADADGSGRYTMTVPVPTAYRTTTLETAPSAWMRVGGRGGGVPVAIPEASVRTGAAVAVPSLGG